MNTVIQCGCTIRKRLLISDRGSVLATVLLVLIVLLTILLSVMTYALSRYGYHRRAQFELVSSHLADAAVQHYLQHSASIGTFPDSIHWSTPGGGLMTCNAQPWGAYQLVRASGKSGAVETVRLNLIGSAPGSLFSSAVVSGDESQPLVVSGHVRITGDVVTGPQGVVRGRYEGESAPDESFHDGDTRVSGVVDVPRLDTNLTSEYLDDMRARLVHADVVIGTTHVCDSADNALPGLYTSLVAESDLILDGVHWSSTGHIFSVGARADLDIRGNSAIDGLIEINCERTIHVADSAVISFAVLWAQDSIVVGGGVSFSGIAITPGIIVVEDNARLLYPALLVSLNHDFATDTCTAIQIRSHQICEGSIVSGTVPLNGTTVTRSVYLDTGSVLLGCILTPAEADIRGTVWGSAVAERYVFSEPPATYTNWIRNAWIDRSRLHHTPALPMLMDSTATARVIAVRDVK